LLDNINTSHLIRATFLQRLNRFTVLCEIKGKAEKAYLPNPGRLWEILLPGRPLYLYPQDSPQKLPFTVMAAEMEGYPIMLHTHLTNYYVQYLLQQGFIQELKHFRHMRREVKAGSRRFDFLLENVNGLKKPMLLEVKTCTLFSGRLALFPDAVTVRGRHHLEELARLKEEKGCEGGVLFVVFLPKARYFLPEYHTDWEFAKTLLRLRHKLFVQAIALELSKDLKLKPAPPFTLEIPWDVISAEAHNRGAYILIFEVEKSLHLSVGKTSLGETSVGKTKTMFLHKGFYIYVGSAKKGLEARLSRHRRRRKNLFWHVDYLREKAILRYTLAIRTAFDLECSIACQLSRIIRVVPGFGASDCKCQGHLFSLDKDPTQFPPFIRLLHEFRYQRIEDKLDNL